MPAIERKHTADKAITRKSTSATGAEKEVLSSQLNTEEGQEAIGPRPVALITAVTIMAILIALILSFDLF